MRKFIKRDECEDDKKILSLDNIGEWEMIRYDRMQERPIVQIEIQGREWNAYLILEQE